MLLIGSRALKAYTDIRREPKDIDVLGSYDDCMAFIKSVSGDMIFCYPIDDGKKIIAKKNETIIEAEIAWPGSTAEMFLQLEPGVKAGSYLIPSLNGLYCLKMSHRYLKNSPAFLKTMNDIHLMRRIGATIPETMLEFFKIREKETYNYNHPVLEQEKKNFFSGDGVEYHFDHDEIHISVAHLGQPAYKFFQKDGADVMVDRSKWKRLSMIIKLYAVLEESYVLSLERSQIPFPGKRTPRQSFEIALKKVCTSITSGWFREFAWENYKAVLGMYDDDYVVRFRNHFKISS